MANAYALTATVGANPATGLSAGQVCNAYKASRFTGAPSTNTAAPGGAADAGPISTTAGPSGTATVTLAVPTNELYYISYYDPADTSHSGSYNLYWAL